MLCPISHASFSMKTIRNYIVMVAKSGIQHDQEERVRHAYWSRYKKKCNCKKQNAINNQLQKEGKRYLRTFKLQSRK